MNDRHKFRVWDKKEKVMLENVGIWGTSFFTYSMDCPLDWIETVPDASYTGMDESWCICDEERFVFEQCTGLKDKNGKLLFDNSKFLDVYSNKTFIVKYIDSVKTFVCFTKKALERYESGSNSLKYIYQESCEVCETCEQDEPVMLLSKFESYHIELTGTIHEVKQ